MLESEQESQREHGLRHLVVAQSALVWDVESNVSERDAGTEAITAVIVFGISIAAAYGYQPEECIFCAHVSGKHVSILRITVMLCGQRYAQPVLFVEVESQFSAPSIVCRQFGFAVACSIIQLGS